MITPPNKRGRKTGTGRKPTDLSSHVGRMIGTRVVVAVERDGHGHQVYLMRCECGRETRDQPLKVRRRGRVCGSCKGSFTRAPRDYEADVGATFGVLTVTAFERSPRPSFTLRCPVGHSFTRLAWDIASGNAHACLVCTGRRARDVGNGCGENGRRPNAVDLCEPEVCDCAFFNGTLRRACNRHRGAA